MKTDYKNPIDQCNSLNPVRFGNRKSVTNNEFTSVKVLSSCKFLTFTPYIYKRKSFYSEDFSGGGESFTRKKPNVTLAMTKKWRRHQFLTVHEIKDMPVTASDT